ncbi:MAG: SprB repeat-containing protein, partial [Salibacteraceae bacterium]
MYFPSSLFLRCFSLGLLLLSALHTKAQLQASSTSTPVTCYQASDGSIDLQVSGGASPYTYSWNNGATTEDLNNLSGGIYSVTVRDAFGALVVHTDTVAAPNGPLSVTTSTSSVDTSNQTGTLNMSVTGGVVPYSYTLNGGAVQSIASQPVLWDQGQFGPSGWWQFNALATDGQGNIYGTGYIWDTVVIDGQTVPRVDPSKNGTDLLFAKFDAQYNLLWYKTAGTTNSAFSSSSNDVSVDNQGNAYVVGSFRDTLYWDTLTLVAQGTSDGFLAKYSPAGDLLWVQTVAGKSDDVVNAIETDDLGNSYITGTFRDSTTLGGDKLYSVGFRDIFVAKFDPTGNKVWGFSGGTTSFDDSRTLCFDPNGDLILAPRMPGSGSIQGNAFSFSASRHILVKVSANGSVQWMEPFSPSTSISLSLNDLATDPAGNIYATGSFGSTLVIGNSTFVNAGPQDFFLAKFSPTGTGLWANIGYTNTTSGLSNVGNEVLVDGSGAIYVAGQAYTGQNIFPSVPQDFTFTSTGQNDAFVVKYNTDGNIIWLKHAMGGGNTDGEGLAIDANGIHLGGGFAGTMTLDGTNYTSSSYSGFLARIDQSQESNLPNLG